MSRIKITKKLLLTILFTLVLSRGASAYEEDCIKGNCIDGFGVSEITGDYGQKYEGYFKNGKRNGKGIINYNNGDKYTGTFKDGYRDGQGTHLFSNGDKYIGEFKEGWLHGKGKMIFNSGEIYDGSWEESRFLGK